MKTTTEKICRTILPEQGEFHCTVGEERYLLAKCDYPKIEVIEQVERIITGGHEARITSFYFSIRNVTGDGSDWQLFNRKLYLKKF